MSDGLDWSRKFAPREEIQQYYAEMARYYNLPQSTSFNTNVISATWDEEDTQWVLFTENIKTGVQKKWTCRVVHPIYLKVSHLA